VHVLTSNFSLANSLSLSFTKLGPGGIVVAYSEELKNWMQVEPRQVVVEKMPLLYRCKALQDAGRLAWELLAVAAPEAEMQFPRHHKGRTVY